MVLSVAEESFNEVFAELIPGGTCCHIVRVQCVPSVAVVDHVENFLEVVAGVPAARTATGSLKSMLWMAQRRFFHCISVMTRKAKLP